MKIAVPSETAPDEHRVALVPESCAKLVKDGWTVGVECGAGAPSHWPDAAYEAVGARVEDDAAGLLESADVVLKVQAPSVAAQRNEVGWMQRGSVLLGSLKPLRNLEVVAALAARGVTSFSTDAIPRTTRAQSMDTLSTESSLAGYKGVLLAAVELAKYFPMLMTAAGMVPSAKVFVIGAGVAGLQAIATAKRLGAMVTATDIRPEVRQQIESVGGRYVGIEPREDASATGGYAKALGREDLERQQALLSEQMSNVDVVITTALIDGVTAPRLISAEMVRSMKAGAVIVDLAADGGGNCELSQPGQTIDVGGVRILAPRNVASTLPSDGSLLFSRNLCSFLQAFSDDQGFHLELEDEIQAGCLVTHEGRVVHAATREAIERAASEAS